mmetsp:Transcript_90879/g.272931  ORF Transcript_90879/g.272931 Transcript_90879/m.272931 type:complete len:435 (+) Transcript_90879:309-1613(+)
MKRSRRMRGRRHSRTASSRSAASTCSWSTPSAYLEATRAPSPSVTSVREGAALCSPQRPRGHFDAAWAWSSSQLCTRWRSECMARHVKWPTSSTARWHRVHLRGSTSLIRPRLRTWPIAGSPLPSRRASATLALPLRCATICLLDVSWSQLMCGDSSGTRSLPSAPCSAVSCARTPQALMPNLEGGSHERLPFFHMIDAVSVPWLVGTDERAEDGGASAGHVAYFWRLETDRPQLSVDYSVLSQRPSLLVPVDGSSDDEDEAAGTAGEEDEGNDGEDLSADGPLAQRLQADMASLVPLAAARFAVLDTQTSRGRGLFVGSERIPLGMYLMDYGGELLNEPQFDARYPSGEGADYAVGIDSTQSGGQAVYIDAANPSMSNLARYMNHCDAAPNCRAATLRSPPRLMLFTTRDVEVGEELVWDYGARYWGQRPDKV